jgi:hypothetical protein
MCNIYIYIAGRYWNIKLKSFLALKYQINWDIYTPYAGAAGMLLVMNEKFTMGKLKSSLLS